MKSIRRNVFETNSSSTHSLTICSKKDFEEWKAGAVVFWQHDQEFVSFTKALRQIKKDNPKIDLESQSAKEKALRDWGFLTYEQWSNSEYLEIFEYSYITEHGDEIVAFGEYGYDG